MEAVKIEKVISQLPEERRVAIEKLRKVILENLPKGFSEAISYGMISFVVPHSIYPDGYHCNPKEPLPFISMASKKNFIALYHMGLYANEDMLNWFKEEYPKHSKTKLDIGKSCIRFKNPKSIPFELIGELCSKMTINEWIEIYEAELKK